MADTELYIDSVNVGGTHYDIADPQARAVATEKYDENVDYAVGDFCIKDDILYKFTKAKTKGPWDAGVVEQTTVPAELKATQKKITDLTEKCTISYEEVEFEEQIGIGHTTAGDVKISAPNHDSKILVGAKTVDYDGAITNNCVVSTPVLTPNRSNWSVRITNLSAAETTVKGKLILTFLG